MDAKNIQEEKSYFDDTANILTLNKKWTDFS